MWHSGLRIGSGCCGGTGSIPSPAQWVKGSGTAATAAQIQSLARELPYAVDAAIKKKIKKPKFPVLYSRQIKPEFSGVSSRCNYFLKDSQLIPISPKLRISCLSGGHMGVSWISTFLDI